MMPKNVQPMTNTDQTVRTALVARVALVAKVALVALMVVQASEVLRISSRASLVAVLLAIQMLLVKETTFSIVST